VSEDSDIERIVRSRIGTTLRGKYRLDAVLGIGGMAAVYKATHRNNAELAIKMLHPSISVRESVRQRFLREGYAANSVKHPGAVLVVDDDVAEDGSAFLVMELMRGSDVETLWADGGKRLPVAAVIEIALQLLDVLIAAHANGIVHRDIKPANVFVTSAGSIKVLDFGIARARDAASGSQGATGTGLVLGTPAFMSPEQAVAKSSDIDAQTDVWAVGASMYTLLSGRMVHEGENAQHVLVQTATTPPRSLRTVAPQLPSPVIELVDRALSFNKAQRWPSAKAMRDALVQVSLGVRGTAGSTADTLALLAGVSSKNATSARVDERLAYAGTVPSAPPGAITNPRTTGGSIAQPVSSAVAAKTAPTARRRRTAIFVGFVAAAGAVVALAAVSRKAPNALPAAPAAVIASGAGDRPASTSPTAATSALAAASAAPSIALSSEAIGSPPALASSVDAGPAPPAPAKAPPPAARPAVRPAANAPAANAAASAKPKCHTTSWLDSSGETHLKEVCE
jgi:serine/threonine-protein kinase